MDAGLWGNDRESNKKFNHLYQTHASLVLVSNRIQYVANTGSLAVPMRTTKGRSLGKHFRGGEEKE